MAEVFFNALAAKRGAAARARSAGLAALDGVPASHNAILAADELGADIAAHRSRQVSRDMAESADVVYCMTGAHLRGMAERYPEYKDKFVMLAQSDIADPYGGDEEIYLRCAGEIYVAVEDILDRYGI